MEVPQATKAAEECESRVAFSVTTCFENIPRECHYPSAVLAGHPQCVTKATTLCIWTGTSMCETRGLFTGGFLNPQVWDRLQTQQLPSVTRISFRSRNRVCLYHAQVSGGHPQYTNEANLLCPWKAPSICDVTIHWEVSLAAGAGEGTVAAIGLRLPKCVS